MTSPVPIQAATTKSQICAHFNCDVCGKKPLAEGNHYVCANGMAKHKYCRPCFIPLPHIFSVQRPSTGGPRSSTSRIKNHGFILQCKLCPFPRNMLQEMMEHPVNEMLLKPENRDNFLFCPNTKYGCSKIKALTKSDVEHHLRQYCLYVPIDCPAKEGCMVPKRILFEHFQIEHGLSFGGKYETARVLHHSFVVPNSGESCPPPGFFFFRNVPVIVRMEKVGSDFYFWMEQDKDFRTKSFILWIGIERLHPVKAKRQVCDQQVQCAGIGECKSEVLESDKFCLVLPCATVTQYSLVGSASSGNRRRVRMFFSLDKPGWEDEEEEASGGAGAKRRRSTGGAGSSSASGGAKEMSRKGKENGN